MLTPPFESLRAIFELSSGKSSGQLTQEFRVLELSAELKNALIQAVHGDNRPLNTWLFSQSESHGNPLAWIAPIQSSQPNYVWMIGFLTSEATKAHRYFDSAHQRTRGDSLLRQRTVPAPLLFVDPIVTSNNMVRSSAEQLDEFAIFQTGYRNLPTEVSDLEQRMVINTPHLVKKRRVAISRFRLLCDIESEVVTELERSLELLGIMHTEGHNEGHFTGVWPFEDAAKKQCMLYEAVEEFRACLASVLIVEHMSLTPIQKDAYALSVFVTRYFGYGYDAFLLSSQRRETVREITVGLMFFEWLLEKRVVRIHWKEDRLYLTVDFFSIRPVLREAFLQIDNAEASLRDRSISGLQEIARGWYRKAFPGADYSPMARMVYTQLGKAWKEVMS